MCLIEINNSNESANDQPTVILSEYYGYGLLEAGTWRNVAVKAVATKFGWLR